MIIYKISAILFFLQEVMDFNNYGESCDAVEKTLSQVIVTAFLISWLSRKTVVAINFYWR